jgi:hypothetical protein
VFQRRQDPSSGVNTGDLTALARQWHRTWWTTKIQKSIPLPRDLESYESFVKGDFVAAQKTNQLIQKNAQASPAKPLQTTAAKEIAVKVDPAVGHDLTELFQVIDVEKDGNCLFRAVAVAVGNSQNLHSAYRRIAVEHMNSYQNDFSYVYQDNLMAYLYTMSEDATYSGDTKRWGSSPEITALSRVYKREILVYLCSNRKIVHVQKHAMDDGPFKPGEDTPPLFLAHQGGNHYSCLRRK